MTPELMEQEIIYLRNRLNELESNTRVRIGLHEALNYVKEHGLTTFIYDSGKRGERQYTFTLDKTNNNDLFIHQSQYSEQPALRTKDDLGVIYPDVCICYSNPLTELTVRVSKLELIVATLLK